MGISIRRRLGVMRTTAWMLPVILLLAGCAGGVVYRPASSGSDNDGDNDSVDLGGNDSTEPDELVIRFINNSDVDVDTQFYFANEALDDPGTELFAPKFLVQTGVGVAGTGIIEAGQDDQITRPCSATTYLGTEGGEFLDPNTGELLATGQARLLRVGESFDCGNTLLFSYTGENGEYDSEPVIPDFRD